MNTDSGSQASIGTERGAPPAVVGRIEVDRFCDGCGYNLFSQGVFRDAHTQLLVCRCPECGRFHHAAGGATIAHLWLHRLALLALWLWILVIVGIVVGLAAAQGGLLIETLEELTMYASVGTSTTQQTLPDGTVITYQVGHALRRVVETDYPYYELFLLLVAATATAIGFGLAAWVVVVLHHWRRWGHFVVVTIVVLGVGGIVWGVWAGNFPLLAGWAVPYSAGLTLAALAGGVTGVYLGRPLARLIVRLLLPPRLRTSLGFLWLADGKPLPQPCETIPTVVAGRARD